MDNRTKIKAVARANAFHGLFQAILQPEGVLTMDEIAERWADYARIERGFAKLQRSFIQIGANWRSGRKMEGHPKRTNRN